MNNNVSNQAVGTQPTVETLDRRKTLRQTRINPRALSPSSGRRRREVPRSESGSNAAWAAIVASCAFLVAGGLWLSVELIFDPESVTWLQPFLPANRFPVASKGQPKTLAEIQASIRKEKLIPAAPLPLDQTNDKTQTKKDNTLLLPVMAVQPCKGNKSGCEQLAQIRIYQPVRGTENSSPGEQYFQLVNSLDVEGPEESFAISSLVDPAAAAASNIPLPLTKVEIFDTNKAPKTGFWFNLSGQRQLKDISLTYGLLVHYNSSTSNISVMNRWNSPAGNQPSWEEITGGEDPELIIDETIGMEPKFKVYQLKPVTFFFNPFELDEISLSDAALPTQAYKNALLLAKNGLWSPAVKLLQSIKQESQKSEEWSTQAQAQLDVMQFHAEITQKQASAKWQNPSQEVLMSLIDGRWKEALKVFEAELNNGEEMATLLTSDTGHLWSRVETALRVNPSQVEAGAWGALIVAAKEGQEQAIAWLYDLPDIPPEGIERIYKLLEQHSDAISEAGRLTSHTSKIVGTALAIDEVNPPDWLQVEPDKSLELKNQQVWYRVQVAAFHDSKSWRQAPFNDISLPKSASVTRLWHQLGLHKDRQLQIVVWMPDGKKQTATATVKAVQIRGGNLELLAAGSVIPLPGADVPVRPLAIAGNALQWLSPQSMTLAVLNEQDPAWTGTILPALWTELQAAGRLQPGQVPPSTQMLEQVGDWLVQLIDLTGNGVPEAVLTLRSQPSRWPAAKPATDDSSRTRTVIFEDTGALIYSELTTAADQLVTGIGDMGDGGLAALVVDGKGGYSLQRWSTERKRFEF